MIKDRIRNNGKILSNFSYLSILEVFILVAPLITYPFLVRVLGLELYGWVLTAQVTASYCTVFIDFGFKSISARHIATNSDNPYKMSEIISAILFLRIVLWLISFIIYLGVILVIDSYREHLLLFIFSFLTTLSSVLFLDFYFQGIENMKYITIINIIVRSLFVAATFIVIREQTDYVYVPLLWSIGYVFGGAISIWVVFYKHKLSFWIPKSKVLKMHLKEGSIIFFSNAMLTIKDKLNYNIMGGLLGMSDIVIYDIGSKISGLLQKPVAILCTVLFPRMAKDPSIPRAKRTMVMIVVFSILIVACINTILPWVVRLFIDEDIDLLAIRLFTIVPIILGVSIFISTNIFYAFGYDKLILKSTYITTVAYIAILVVMYYGRVLNSVCAFVLLTLSAYVIECGYRLFLCRKIFLEKK